MADLRRLYVELATNVRPLVAGMAQASTATKRFGRDVLQAGQDLDAMATKAALASRRVVEAQLRQQAAEERLKTLRASGRASIQQQAQAEAQLIAAERNLARAQEQSAVAATKAQGGAAALGTTGARTRNVLATVAAVAGGALVLGLTASAHAALELEKRLYNVASISPDVAGDIDKYRKIVVGLSTELPQSANELADGFYNIVSSGFQADDALTVLDASARAASAGLTTTEVSAKAISAVLKAYGLSAGSAGDVSDALFKTVQDGVITFEELAQGVGDYIGTGAAAKVNIGELGAAISAMTLSGVSAAESGTSLNRVLQSIVKPSVALSNELSRLGYESGAQALATDGLYKVMERLRGATGGTVESMLALFPEIRAARGAFALMAADGQNYTTSFNDIATINGRVGATQAALAQQQKSGAYQIKILKNEATALGIEIGQTLLPAVKFIVGGLQDFLGMLNAVPGPVTAVVTLLAALSGAALLGVGAFIRFRAPIAQFRASLASMRAEGSALPAALRGTALAAGALTAALAIGTIAYGHYAAQKAKAKAMTDEFVDALKSEAAGQKDAVQSSVIEQVVKNNAKGLEALKKQGVQAATVVEALSGTGDKQKTALSEIASAMRGMDFGASQQVLSLLQVGDGVENARTQFSLLNQVQKQTAATTAKASGPLADLASTTKLTADGTSELDDATKAFSKTLAGMVDPADAAKEALTGLTDPAKVLSDVQSKLDDANKDHAASSLAALKTDNQSRLRAAQDRVRSVQNTGKAEKQAAAANLVQVRRDNQDRLAAYKKGGTDQKATLADWTAGLRSAAQEQAAWQKDLTTVAQRAGVDVADALRSMGKDAVPLVHQLATGTQSEVDKVKSAFASLAPSAQQSLGAFTAELQKQLQEQASYASNLVVLASRGHADLAGLLQTMDPEQAAPLAAQAVQSRDPRQLALLDRLAAQQNAIAGGGSDALATNVQHAMEALELMSKQGGKAAADAFVQAFGGVDQAKLYIDALKQSIQSIPVRKQLDIILNLLAPKPVTIGLGLPSRQGHMNDRDVPAHAIAGGGGRGGLNPSVGHSYAEGKLPSEAMIADGRRTRIAWAEPETGGEAFIPMGAHKRARSTRILSDVASSFGMAVVPAATRSFAAGGMTLPARSGGGGMSRVDANDLVAAFRIALSQGPFSKQTGATFNGPVQVQVPDGKFESFLRQAERKRIVGRRTGNG